MPGAMRADDRWTGNLEAFYQLAVTRRPELHEQLAAIRRDRFQVDRARLNYYPDLTYGAQLGSMTTNRALAPTADGLDMVGLNVSFNVPVYRKRINAGIREHACHSWQAAKYLNGRPSTGKGNASNEQPRKEGDQEATTAQPEPSPK